jgi:transcriptional regulator with XRE-family HTH domain
VNKLKEVLKVKRIRQKWLAEKLYGSENTISNLVKGKTKSSLDDLDKIAENIDCPIIEFLEESR